jgi:hypothetical protein
MDTMKNPFTVLSMVISSGIIVALAAVIAFAFTGCPSPAGGGGGGGGGGGFTVYSGTVKGAVFRMVVRSPAPAASVGFRAAGESDDMYDLTIRAEEGAMLSILGGNVSGLQNGTYTLKDKRGWTFTITIEGGTITGGAGIVAGDNLLAYDLDAGAFLTKVTLAEIPDVSQPVVFVMAAREVGDNEEYTGTVEWSPVATAFAPGTSYTATITLTPKAGYTLIGVPVNFFKLPGADSVTNAANSGAVTAKYPDTDTGS